MARSISFTSGGQLCASNENTYVVQIDENKEAVGSVQRLLNSGNC